MGQIESLRAYYPVNSLLTYKSCPFRRSLMIFGVALIKRAFILYTPASPVELRS
jgi:hypothetical protein